MAFGGTLVLEFGKGVRSSHHAVGSRIKRRKRIRVRFWLVFPVKLTANERYPVEWASGRASREAFRLLNEVYDQI